MKHLLTPAPLFAVAILQESASLEAQVAAVNDAIWRRNDTQLVEETRWYPVDVFEASVIVRRGRQLFQVPYTTEEDGDISFGEPSPVEVEYRPIQIQESELSLLEAAAGDPEGLDWEVVIIQPGMSKTGLYYPAETLRESVALFEGVHVFVFDDDGREHKANPIHKTQRKMAGWIDGVKVTSSGALQGVLHFLQEGVAAETRAKLVDAWKRGKKDLLGLSIDARGTTRQENVGGKRVRLVESIIKALSVEVVMHPAAGGQFTRLVASATATTSKEDSMDKRTKRLLRLLEARRPDAIAVVDRENVSFGELAEIATEEELQESFREEAGSTTVAPANTAAATATAASPQTTVILQEAEKSASRYLVKTMLQESRLPELVQKRIEKRLEGQVVREEQIQAAIDDERQYAASLNPARVQVPGGGGGVQVGANKLDRLQAGLDRAFGLEIADPGLRTIAPLGLRRLYDEITLGHDSSVGGILAESAQQEMLQESFTSATLPNVLANTLHRRLLKDYAAVSYGEQFLYSKRPGGVKDFKTQESVRVGYFGDLSTVDPESADYQEIAAYGEEKASYSVGQKGNLVTISRKHIINDDLGHVVKIVSRLGRAARRTFAQFVWDFFIDNGVIYDTTAWFTVGHLNLQTAALTVAALNAAELALFNQTELSSAKKLGLGIHTLAVPGALKATAIAINQSQLIPGSTNNDANPWYHRFGENNERIIVNPLFSDANDWGVFANQADADIIEVGFLNDQEEPELFVADMPTVGQMFVADEIVHKIRHEYGGAVVDFRSAVKAVVV